MLKFYLNPNSIITSKKQNLHNNGYPDRFLDHVKTNKIGTGKRIDCNSFNEEE